MKRFFSILSLCAICLLNATSALSAPTKGSCGNGVKWDFDVATGVLTISGKGKMKDYDYYPDNKKAPWRRYYYDQIETIVIEEGVTEIGSYAFYTCKADSIIIPNSVTRIHEYAFRNCPLLEVIHIPANVQDIFWSCWDIKNLRRIEVDPQNKYYTSEDGILFSKDKAYFWRYPAAKNDLTIYAMPPEVENFAWSAFTGNKTLRKLVLSNRIQKTRTWSNDKIETYLENLEELYYPEGCNISEIKTEKVKLIPYDPTTYRDYYDNYKKMYGKEEQTEQEGGDSKLNTNGQALKVAILAPVDKEGNVEYAPKLMLRSYLAQAITESDGYAGYDRVDMDAITSEQQFQRTGLVSDDEIKRIGVLAGVQYILISEAVKVDDNNMYITAKLIDVETARTEKVDYQLMGTTPDAIQKGCATMAKNLLAH